MDEISHNPTRLACVINHSLRNHEGRAANRNKMKMKFLQKQAAHVGMTQSTTCGYVRRWVAILFLHIVPSPQEGSVPSVPGIHTYNSA